MGTKSEPGEPEKKEVAMNNKQIHTNFASNKWCMRFALILPIAAYIFYARLSEWTVAEAKYEIISLVLSPFVQLGWELGFIENAMFDLKVKSTIGSSLASPEYLRKIKQVELSEKDIVLATWPKSGTHLMSHMLLQIVGDGTVEFNNLHEYVSVMEIEHLDPKNPKCEDTLESFLDRGRRQTVDMNVIGTHLHSADAPYYSEKAKYVICMRDQRDAFLSAKNMLVKLVGERLVPRDEVLYRAMFAPPKRASYAEWHRAWWDLTDNGNVLFVFYEDIVKNLTETVIQVTEFLGKPVVPEIIEKVRYKSSLEYMKPNANKFEIPGCVKPVPIEKPNRKVDMINKGQSGRGKRYVSQELQQDMDKRLKEAFENTSFPLHRYSFLEEQQK